MAESRVAAGGGVLEVRGEDEGVAGDVEGGDAVVGERGGCSSCDVYKRAGVRVQRRVCQRSIDNDSTQRVVCLTG